MILAKLSPHPDPPLKLNAAWGFILNFPSLPVTGLVRYHFIRVVKDFCPLPPSFTPRLLLAEQIPVRPC